MAREVTITREYIENQRWDEDTDGFKDHRADRALSRRGKPGRFQAASAAARLSVDKESTA